MQESGGVKDQELQIGDSAVGEVHYCRVMRTDVLV